MIILDKAKTKISTSIGGQALIEGIMMRGPKKTSVAVRASDGSIYSENIKHKSITKKISILKFPILRGVSSFIDSMLIGYKALTISTEKSIVEDNEEKKISKFDKWLSEKLGNKTVNVIMTISSVLGIALSILLFFIFPTWVYNLISSNFDFLNDRLIYRSTFEGIFRIIIFLVYVIFCSQVKEFKRVFQYHGAEHKTIFCYENKENLTVENVKKHSRFHPRCGTSFIVIMILIGIIVGLFIPFSNPFLRSFIKILCIPIMLGLGYELIKICGKYNNIFTKIISTPGLWVQRITTKEPENDMIEVAISAIVSVIPENGEDITNTL